MHVIAFLCCHDSMHMEDQLAMSNFDQQTTAAGNAIRPAAVATTKCPPLFDRDTHGHVPVGFAKGPETGDSPEITGNDRGLYEGALTGYFRALIFHATNLPRPYHNLRHMLHVTWLCYQA